MERKFEIPDTIYHIKLGCSRCSANTKVDLFSEAGNRYIYIRRCEGISFQLYLNQ